MKQPLVALVLSVIGGSVSRQKLSVRPATSRHARTRRWLREEGCRLRRRPACRSGQFTALGVSDAAPAGKAAVRSAT